MLSISAASAVIGGVRLAVRHVRVLCQNDYSYLQFFFTVASQTILVSTHKTVWQYFDGNPITDNGGSNEGEICKQEAQVSQKDRVMLHVIEYFAKSLKIIENGTIRKLGYGFLFAFCSYYVRIFSHF